MVATPSAYHISTLGFHPFSSVNISVEELFQGLACWEAISYPFGKQATANLTGRRSRRSKLNPLGLLNLPRLASKTLDGMKKFTNEQ